MRTIFKYILFKKHKLQQVSDDFKNHMLFQLKRWRAAFLLQIYKSCYSCEHKGILIMLANHYLYSNARLKELYAILAHFAIVELQDIQNISVGQTYSPPPIKYVLAH